MFTTSAFTGTAPLTVNLDASDSNDADGSITSYNWQSSAGQSASGATASLNFTSPGDYTITLTVTDDKGVTSQAVKNITVSGSAVSQTGFVSRKLGCYIAGTKLTVSLTATPASSISSYAVEDTPPSGWTVSNISDSGTYDSVNNRVKYGPFFDSTARTLSYDATPPSGTAGDNTFTGTASADGDNSTIGGDSVVSVCADTHPADTDNNFAVSISEVTAYGSAWKKGATWTVPPNPIPIDYLTRAGAIWKSGEKYKYNSGSGNCPLCWINSSARRISRSADSTALCDMPSDYTPGQAFTVSIAVTPSSSAMVYAVEDSVPAGWTVSSVDNAGAYDSVNNKVKYGPFFDNTARTFTYQITPPATASGSYTFTGTASFDGSVNIAITGDRTVSDGTIAAEIKGDVNGDGKLDLQDVIYILQILTGIRK